MRIIDGHEARVARNYAAAEALARRRNEGGGRPDRGDLRGDASARAQVSSRRAERSYAAGDSTRPRGLPSPVTRSTDRSRLAGRLLQADGVTDAAASHRS